MIRALLFDFNGVVVDDEPLHFKLFQQTLRENGWELHQKDYYEKYLGMDDYDCFTHALRDQGVMISQDQLEKLVAQKNAYYFKSIEENPPFVPGVLEWIKDVGKTHFLGIVSGALRQEIEYLLKLGNVHGYFSVIVAAGEIEEGKPSPEGYLKAMDLLNRDFVADSVRLLASECLVLEDSVWGLQAAQAAGMPAIGLTTSYPAQELPGALFYYPDFCKEGAREVLKRVEAKLKEDAS